MAQKRMFSNDITDRDRFYELPIESQLLYFHLGMKADVKGFVEVKKILRLVGIKPEACKPLLQEKLIIAFDSGVIVITDWNVNNTVRTDREAPTRFINELKMLELSSTNEYVLKGQLQDYSWSSPAQYSVVEVSVDKIKLVENSNAKNEFSPLGDNSIKEGNKQQDSMEALGIHADTYAEPQNIPSQTQDPSMEGNKFNTFSIKGEASEPEGAGTKAEKKKGSAKKEKKDPNEPQTLEEFITSCKSSSQAHIRVIGEWAEAMQPRNNTRGQWDSYLKRNLRAATTLSPYPVERLQLALDLLLKDKKTDQNPNGYITKYTLETLSKYIDLV